MTWAYSNLFPLHVCPACALLHLVIKKGSGDIPCLKCSSIQAGILASPVIGPSRASRNGSASPTVLLLGIAMTELLGNQPVVLDNGSGILKAGFAGGERPRVVINSYVGRPKLKRAMAGGALEGKDLFVGRTVEEHRGAMRISYPMANGVVQDWSDMEAIWAHVYDRDNLNVSPEEHPVLLTEAPLNPYANRRRCAEVFLEQMGAPAIFVAPQAILSLYASGRTTGVVLDCGDGVTHCVPVYEGFAVPHAITRIDVAGRDVTERLALLLRRAGCSLHTSSEMEVVKQIKEELCYVAFNPGKEEELRQADAQYKLPDGSTVAVGPERFRAPEVLFRPDLAGSEFNGVADCVVSSVMHADRDLRATLFSQIVLSGGSTCFPGFGDRLLNEVVRKASPKSLKIRISAPPERKISTWVGGSILASLATFKTMWVSKADYEEHGSSIVDKHAL
ncbi:unnamed protein product [Chrysoparadoxa australica]